VSVQAGIDRYLARHPRRTLEKAADGTDNAAPPSGVTTSRPRARPSLKDLSPDQLRLRGMAAVDALDERRAHERAIDEANEANP
jgi:hypothetical protein